MTAPTRHLLSGTPVGAPGRIGPNALLQLAGVLDETVGQTLRDRVFLAGGVAGLPAPEGMIPEGPVAAVHKALRTELGEATARPLARAAGVRTADYILARRIPKPAQVVLRLLPARLSARILAKAIARNAWTFAGSGRFRVVAQKPLEFELLDNPMVRGERSETPLCQWHEAVFETLFRRLASKRYRCREVACGAQGGGACRFVLTLLPR
jgi:divinyl protochlorophyllide a 8-vinyl-reductase